VNDATLYSNPWRQVNTTAKKTVITKAYNPAFLSPLINEWCEYVTVTPDDRSIIVFNKGNSKGFIDSIPKGGHFAPNSIVGDNALWKKAQKIAKKNNTSDIINNATPMFKPLCTANVWLPRYVPSEIISLNHKAIEYATPTRVNNKILLLWKNKWNVKAAENVIFNNDMLVLIGQGLGKTKWKEWNWKEFLIPNKIFFIINKYKRYIKV
jgi:hypothetical protein